MVPSSQLRHESSETAFKELEYVPAGHKFLKPNAQYEPAEQSSVHSVVLPGVDQCPLAQKEQELVEFNPVELDQVP